MKFVSDRSDRVNCGLHSGRSIHLHRVGVQIEPATVAGRARDALALRRPSLEHNSSLERPALRQMAPGRRQNPLAISASGKNKNSKNENLPKELPFFIAWNVYKLIHSKAIKLNFK